MILCRLYLQDLLKVLPALRIKQTSNLSGSRWLKDLACSWCSVKLQWHLPNECCQSHFSLSVHSS
ncbi:hypothetical protein SLEP1_g1854 [Rubroshorea leprosula]|uniref:Uncharacterized protein n=1 Tax=Rubroshorea leprosula TaxID=152421 RepID=A0AAV5HF69_9ROSI|nr:hypothetical protein SLEP1_g1854 [Rubroshorea leprosula]